MSKALAKVLLR